MLEIAQNLRNFKQKWDWFILTHQDEMIPKEKFFTKDSYLMYLPTLNYFKYSEAILIKLLHY
jgi:hypothetical protein